MSDSDLPRLERRTNGLAPEAPEPGQLVLVAGGAGYIGSVLTASACSTAATASASSTASTGAASRSREYLDQVEIVEADVRDMPTTAFDGVDG